MPRMFSLGKVLARLLPHGSSRSRSAKELSFRKEIENDSPRGNVLEVPFEKIVPPSLQSAVARAVATVVMFPLDTLKTRLQSASSARLSSRDALRAVWTQGRFYNGLGSTLVGQVPYGALTFGTYECYKQLLEDLDVPSRRLRWVLAAVLGDLTGSLWLTPSELIKQQLQNMHSSGTVAAQSTSAWRVFRQCWQQYGIAGLYRGYSGQVARDVPFRAIQLLLFEDGRERLERRQQRPLTSFENLAMGAYAGSVTAAVTTPLDVIKTRLMTDRTYRHAGEAFWQLLRTQPRALFRGIVPRVTYIAPSSAIFFIVYTFLQRQWGARVAHAHRLEPRDLNARKRCCPRRHRVDWPTARYNRFVRAPSLRPTREHKSLGNYVE
ncbi:hypothetical protein F1559_004309 [Cyanidiococcus yangmingshanensis]|uniref:Uncharacterized protein n=1 Tax=Cyanidiococcus yangmingshanensis TaxID=2690220 RepID=A0A7J7IJZ3_9RHOD|nr:hypothetical protein F1559_004309 [Cyanidiococcus yangmingshanensis]